MTCCEKLFFYLRRYGGRPDCLLGCTSGPDFCGLGFSGPDPGSSGPDPGSFGPDPGSSGPDPGFYDYRPDSSGHSVHDGGHVARHLTVPDSFASVVGSACAAGTARHGQDCAGSVLLSYLTRDDGQVQDHVGPHNVWMNDVECIAVEADLSCPLWDCSSSSLHACLCHDARGYLFCYDLPSPPCGNGDPGSLFWTSLLMVLCLDRETSHASPCHGSLVEQGHLPVAVA